MDINIRYWNNLSSEVTARYFGIECLGKFAHEKIYCSNEGSINK